MIRILLVDDQKTFREFLEVSLKSTPDLKVVGTASDGDTAIEQVEILQPDLILMDVEMPNLDGISATQIICKRFPKVKVIILSMHDSDGYIVKAIQAGAMGYLFKNTPAKELEETIRLVHRGYGQIAPGLLKEIVPLPQPSVNTTVNDRDSALPPLRDRQFATKEVQSQSQSLVSNSKPKGKRFYLKIWLLSNLIIWSVSSIYIQFKQSVYQSKWTIALPASNSSASIDIPGVGQASSQSESPYNSDFSDPRENYRYLAKTEAVLIDAAKSVNMTLEEFGQPKIETPGNTTLIEFQIEASQPKKAQAKAIALQNSLQASLKHLRRDESSDRIQDLEETLVVADKKLKTARQKLARFKLDSGLSSTDQTSNFTYNIEQLRKQKVELVAQAQKVKSRFNQLQSSLKITPQTAANALALQSDSQFKEYLTNYSQASRELANLKAKFSANHPSIIEKEAELNQTQAELYRRGERILGQPITENDLKNISADGGSSLSQRANLFQELVLLQAEEKGVSQQRQVLQQQINELEDKLATMSQSGLQLQQLEKDVQLAQAVYSSTATKLELSRSEISASYPPVSIISPPTIPQSAAAPKKSLVMLGSLMSSLLLSSGLYTLWLKEKRDSAQNKSSIIVVPQLERAVKANQNGKNDYSLPSRSSKKANSSGSDKN